MQQNLFTMLKIAEYPQNVEITLNLRQINDIIKSQNVEYNLQTA